MAENQPAEGQIVFVRGGIAQYRDGVFYTGMENPRYTRPIQWSVDWWEAIDDSSVYERAHMLEREIAALKQQLAEREKRIETMDADAKMWAGAYVNLVREKQTAEARVKELEGELKNWQDYFGCEDPRDSYLQAGTFSGPIRAAGNAQAEANILRSLLSDLISAAEPFLKYLEGVDSRITHGIIERGLEVGALRALAAAVQKAREGLPK